MRSCNDARGLKADKGIHRGRERSGGCGWAAACVFLLLDPTIAAQHVLADRFLIFTVSARLLNISINHFNNYQRRAAPLFCWPSLGRSHTGEGAGVGSLLKMTTFICRYLNYDRVEANLFDV